MAAGSNSGLSTRKLPAMWMSLMHNKLCGKQTRLTCSKIDSTLKSFMTHPDRCSQRLAANWLIQDNSFMWPSSRGPQAIFCMTPKCSNKSHVWDEQNSIITSPNPTSIWQCFQKKKPQSRRHHYKLSLADHAPKSCHGFQQLLKAAASLQVSLTYNMVLIPQPVLCWQPYPPAYPTARVFFQWH